MNRITRRFFPGVLLTVSMVVGDTVSVAAPASTFEAESTATVETNQASATLVTNALPPLPAGVSELKFHELFRQPIGPRGLEYTKRLRGLEGRRVRILGYMVRQEQPVDHGFLFSPVPLTLHEKEYGLADDLPVTALHVFTTKDLPARLPYTPGPMLLTGKLSLGSRPEADGRVSVVRLHLDPPTPEQKQAAGHHEHTGHSH